MVQPHKDKDVGDIGEFGPKSGALSRPGVGSISSDADPSTLSSNDISDEELTLDEPRGDTPTLPKPSE